jgi:hypothetical protein
VAVFFSRDFVWEVKAEFTVRPAHWPDGWEVDWIQTIPGKTS